MLEKIVSSRAFNRFIVAVILANAVMLGMETSDSIMAAHGPLLHALDRVVIGIFVVELTMKLVLWRGSFFRNGWNVFDFIVVAISLMPMISMLSVLRVFRVFRVFRLISVVPQMRRVVSSLFRAIPGMASILAVLLVVFYVAAVMATQIFGHTDDPVMEDLFGSIGDSMYTLFQLMTLEGWSADIAEPTMVHYPWSWAFFVTFIVVTTFAVLNLFIGIIVDAMNMIHDEEDIENHHQVARQDDIDSLRADIAELKTLLENRDGRRA
ncbi:ion transporter [Micavibrio aeruginosavorus]|uniref:Voltage-gated sodium channel subunit n=1 Tax=Micavibrio aeruginosavorus EPB TaxID=349215 RepID=M4W0N6_9BACT|nr:ion transporter [Micavibrio aeruginosavorus]AGH98979.1 Voltage-gated sodium channel subunit [Micavibrio aeruginosavorus EPB]